MRPFNFIFIIFLLISIKGWAQTSSNTPNIGFENGTFGNWQCYIGDVDPAGNIVVVPTAATPNRQTIIGPSSSSLRDPYGNFPMLCPNGSKYSVRLGNSDTSHQAERLTYTFKVPNGGAYSIIFNYAVVLENPDHLPYQQPKFSVKVYDVTDASYINCPSFDFVASSSLPGFKLSSKSGDKGSPVTYKDWSTATIDLGALLGKTVRLEFTTNDCALGGHFGYAYLDINEDNGASIAGNAYCVGQKSMTLFAPNGFASYTWYNANLTRTIGFGQSLTISPPPPDLTTYAVKILPYQGIGCADVLYTTVNKIDEGFKLNVEDTVYGCPGEGVDLTAKSITAGSSPGTVFSYFNDALGTSYLYDPDKVTASGTYYIQGVNPEGCMNILPVQVIVALPDIDAIDPPPVTFPVTVDLTKTFTPQNNVTYSFFKDADANTHLENYTAITYGGVYYIKAVNSAGCVNIVPVNVVIHPPPPYLVTAPNVFTPNNDGINDHFAVTLKGQVTFKTITIYNRYGKLVYTAKSPNEYWDGNFNGENLPVGTYYWVFEGTDNYYRTRVSRAAAITLLR